MTVKEYNKEFLPKVNGAKTFVNALEHIIERVFAEDITDKEEVKKLLLEVLHTYGWSEETKQLIWDALECYRKHEGIDKLERYGGWKIGKRGRKMIEETIKDIKENIQPSVGGKSLEMAIEALEKQMPKKPTYDGDGYAPDGSFVWDEWLCPNCNSRYEVDYDEYDYCPNCGQALDWSADKR